MNFQHWIEKLSNLGVQPEQDAALTRKIRVANQITLLIMVLEVFYIVISYLFSPPLLNIFVAGSIASVVILYLMSAGALLFARFLACVLPMIIAFTSHIGIVASGDEPLLGMIVCSVCFWITPWLFFRLREAIPLSVGSAVGAFCTAATRTASGWFEPAKEQVNAELLRSAPFELLQISTGIIVMFGGLYILLNENRQAQRRAVAALAQAEARNQELNQAAEQARATTAQLQAAQAQERELQWVSEGIGRANDLQRSHDDLATICDLLVAEAVKHTAADQGAIYLLNSDSLAQSYLYMASCYAYGRKKFLSHKIAPGEGLVGQIFMEKESLLIEQLPPDYAQISSSLGQAAPNYLALVPIKNRSGQVVGVMEIAAFKKLGHREMSYLEQLCESMAVSLITARAAERNKLLLQQAQQQAEEMRTREEEMRQNMEELASTQEELSRVNRSTAQVMQMVEELVCHVELNTDRQIVWANQNLANLLEYEAYELQGLPHRVLVSFDHYSETDYERFWDRLLSGSLVHEKVYRKSKSGKTICLDAVYYPIFDTDGNMEKIYKLAYPITE